VFREAQINSKIIKLAIKVEATNIGSSDDSLNCPDPAFFSVNQKENASGLDHKDLS
jgi:hypothetical protein